MYCTCIPTVVQYFISISIYSDAVLWYSRTDSQHSKVWFSDAEAVISASFCAVHWNHWSGKGEKFNSNLSLIHSGHSLIHALNPPTHSLIIHTHALTTFTQLIHTSSFIQVIYLHIIGVTRLWQMSQTHSLISLSAAHTPHVTEREIWYTKPDAWLIAPWHGSQFFLPLELHMRRYSNRMFLVVIRLMSTCMLQW